MNGNSAVCVSACAAPDHRDMRAPVQVVFRPATRPNRRLRVRSGAPAGSRQGKAECSARFRVLNSITLEPDTIAAWPSAARTRRTAIPQPPQPLTRSGSPAAQSTAVIHCRMRPYSVEEAEISTEISTGGRDLLSLAGWPRTFFFPARRPAHLRHRAGRSRARRPGSEHRSHSPAGPRCRSPAARRRGARDRHAASLRPA